MILTGIITALIGVLLIVFRNTLADGGIVFAAGTLFVAAGLLNMTFFLGTRDKNGRARMGAFGTAFGWIASAAAVVLGLAMLIFSKAFVALVGFMFAVLILFAALFQMGLLLFGARPHRLSSWYFTVPMLLVCCAVFIFMRKPDTAGEHLVMTLTGISFILFGIATIAEGCYIGNANRLMLKNTPDRTSPATRSLPENSSANGTTASEIGEKHNGESQNKPK